MSIRKRIGFAAVLTVLVAGATAFAAFEGILEMKTTMSSGDAGMKNSGVMKIAVSKAGTRTEMNMPMGAMGGMKHVMLQRFDAPEKMISIDDANKTYTVMDLSKLGEAAAAFPDSEPYTVKKLGEETLLGYKTQHVLVTHGTMEMEMWISKDLIDGETFRRMQAKQGKMSGAGFMKALKDAGADGMPIKSVTNLGNGGKAIVEVTKIDKKSLPASTFEIPAGYTESKGPDMMGGMSGPGVDAAKKAMADAMKKMTPEQRQAMQKAMTEAASAGQ